MEPTVPNVEPANFASTFTPPMIDRRVLHILTRFKKGWSTSVRPTYLGRHVARPDRYEALCGGQGGTGYFPAYREA
jgi:hypothetical protein